MYVDMFHTKMNSFLLFYKINAKIYCCSDISL